MAHCNPARLPPQGTQRSGAAGGTLTGAAEGPLAAAAAMRTAAPEVVLVEAGEEARRAAKSAVAHPVNAVDKPASPATVPVPAML